MLRQNWNRFSRNPRLAIEVDSRLDSCGPQYSEWWHSAIVFPRWWQIWNETKLVRDSKTFMSNDNSTHIDTSLRRAAWCFLRIRWWWNFLFQGSQCRWQRQEILTVDFKKCNLLLIYLSYYYACISNSLVQIIVRHQLTVQVEINIVGPSQTPCNGNA